MKNIFIFLQGFLLSMSANALNIAASVQFNQNRTDDARVAGDGTGTCIQGKSLDKVAGDGTGTCIQGKLIDIGKMGQSSPELLRELAILNMIQNKITGKNQNERDVIIQKLEDIYNESQK